VGRPRRYGAETEADLLEAAEQVLEEGGLAALSVRALAERTGVTTRAIYSVFTSKGHLLARLAVRGFDLLGRRVAELPVTDDPEADLVEAGLALRAFAARHPALYALAFGLDRPTADDAPSAEAARGEALAELRARVARVGGSVDEPELGAQVRAFHALCEGLAALERRRALQGEQAWRTALAVCVRGIAAPRPGLADARSSGRGA